MTEQELCRAIIKEQLLAMHRFQDALSAVYLVLKERGLIENAEYHAALARVRELSKPDREKVEKLGPLDPMLEFLRGFQGPLQ
jgi:hypothetical protein